MAEDATYGLLVAFPDDSDSFVHGFEAGQVWEAMQRSDPEIERTVHIANETVLTRMAHTAGYSWDWTDLGDRCWAVIRLAKVRPAKPSAVATGRLSVIEGDRND